MPGEFQIIHDYFARKVECRDLVLGIGDDGAVLRSRTGFDQVVVTDTLVEGRHFPVDSSAADIGWRALAVNLSDIAAMGAVPRFAFLNLTLPEASPRWLEDFANGFFALAQASQTVLAGGDTTQGPLSVTVTLIGEVAEGKAVTRGGAQAGDVICISGTPGEAAAGLELIQSGKPLDDRLVPRFRRPTPRLALGAVLPDHVHAAIDVSDGLLADLGHILDASAVGARIDAQCLPLSDALRRYAGSRALELALAGGDDYELCFCLSSDALERLRQSDIDCTITPIGMVTSESGFHVVDENGREIQVGRSGWEHFDD